jgi:hypothetical protein
LLIMRRSLLGLMVVVGFSMVGSDARAQIGGGINDPFFAYYSFYLPRQQAQAMQPGPEATINAVTANRQYYAATNRNGMFDPNSTGGDGIDSDEYFPGRPRKAGKSSAGTGGRAVHGGNLNGLGPQGYYNSKLSSYYPNIKSGRGRNSYTYTPRGRGFSGGAAGLGGGMPGPR